MIDSAALLADLQAQLKVLTADLRAQAEDGEVEWSRDLRREHHDAVERERTGLSWPAWRDGEVDQAAVAWLVATTFIRFCEDNRLLDGSRDETGRLVAVPWIAGPGDRLARAVENETMFYRQSTTANARDWLQVAFGVLASLPAGRLLLDRTHNQVWEAPISAQAATDLVGFWRRTDTDGDLVHDFSDPDLDTRFLGDLYQDLSAFARDKYALLQTPEFVEELILELTLDPAVREFGLEGLKLIDPTCGSGHFLLGAFARLDGLWRTHAPGLDDRARVQRALDSINGVDLNPFAVAISRFRLTVAALKASGETSLVAAPEYKFRLAIGDSLLAAQGRQGEFDLSGEDDEEPFTYAAEDVEQYRGILEDGCYHVVVGNPPYITVKDKALNTAYRAAYPGSTKGKYALSAPFMELFFKLARRQEGATGAGFIGQITSNSFMKREFGTKVVENLLSGADYSNPVDLTHVVDTSGAYIPGHGTPTVILIGRRRRPVGDTVRAVLGKRGEPGQPTDPAKGLVWTEIVTRLDRPGYDGTHVTITDLDRDVLAHHPWSLSGGGASQLLQQVESAAHARLNDRLEGSIGFASFPGNDEPFFLGEAWFKRHPDSLSLGKILVVGEVVRDWDIRPEQYALAPYNSDASPVPFDDSASWGRHLWPNRRVLEGTIGFGGQTQKETGDDWWTWYRWVTERYRTPLSITFAFVATHNHFVLDRGGKVFNRSAPVIKLPEGASEDEHLDLLGVLNSSVACFWLKQVSYPKGGDPIGDKGARVSASGWDDRYEFTGTKLQEFPLPLSLPRERARRLDAHAQKLTAVSPTGRVEAILKSSDVLDSAVAARAAWEQLRQQMIFQQEELDWETYLLYGLIDNDLTYAGSGISELDLGERAFEIALARAVSAGTEHTAWFDRHGSTPITDMPTAWPADYRELVQRRLDLIESDPFIGLLERPEYKRRWQTDGWDAQLTLALESVILDRLEDPELWRDSADVTTRSLAQLVDALRNDSTIRRAAHLLTGDLDADLSGVVGALMAKEAVPFLAAHRYKPSGMEKRREWEKVWDLQRREDEGKKVSIQVPPRYTTPDFRQVSYWQARGKLDVPKERFISYPGTHYESDPSPIYGWAGWDHRDQAIALARLVGQTEDRLPLVAGLMELEPWLKQWHNVRDAATGTSPAETITAMIEGELDELGTTRDTARAWEPPATTRKRRKK